MKVTGIHHIGISVEDVDKAVEQYRKLLGVEVGEIFTGGTGSMRAAFARLGDVAVELVQPLRPESRSGRIVAEKGYGISHLALRVDNFDQAVAELKAEGVEFMDEPWTTSFGERAVFTEARSLGGVNLELLGK